MNALTPIRLVPEAVYVILLPPTAVVTCTLPNHGVHAVRKRTFGLGAAVTELAELRTPVITIAADAVIAPIVSAKRLNSLMAAPRATECSFTVTTTVRESL